MTLNEIKKYCKEFKTTCVGCDFSYEEDGLSRCFLRNFTPSRWDMDNIQVIILDKDDEKLYEKFKDLPDLKKFEYFKKCYEQEDHNVS